MLLTAEELKARLGISSTIYYQLKKEGRLPPSIKLGKQVRYPVEAVEAWIKANTK